jgi:hypothetical protein
MENNKLIAEFMGAVGTPKYNPTEWDVYITGCLDVDSDDEKAQHFYTPDEMKYHTSWDWLMPVVEKIEEELEEEFRVVILEHECSIHQKTEDKKLQSSFECVVEAFSTSKIEATYNAVVQFIKDHKATYPFNEGDDYWVVEDGMLIYSCWDDVSEEIHDENPNTKYLTEEEALAYAKEHGIKYK